MKRFLVIGGPAGYLATISPRQWREQHNDPRWRRWQVLFAVNRPLTTELREAALTAVFRCYDLV